jgi:AcrR family transcriptional regulator
VAASTAPTRRTARDQLRQARREVSRLHLMQAAERVFAARGYEQARMQDVAQEAGLAMATVYDLVSSKEDLYAEIYRARGSELLAYVAQAQGDSRSAMDLLRNSIKAYVEYLCAHPDYLRVQLRERQPWALLPHFNSDEQRRQWQQGLQMATAVFRAAVAEGHLRADEDPETMARLMIAAHQVYLSRWLEQGMGEPVAALIERMQRHVTRAFGAEPTERERS